MVLNGGQEEMGDENRTTNLREEAIRRRGECRTEDLDRLRREAGKGIERKIDSGKGATGKSKSRVTERLPKTGIFIRLDNDILAYFRKHGRGYQARINAVLRGYMDAQTTENSGPAAAGRSGLD